MSKTHLYLNAWREILARVFAQTPTQTNVSPEWLVNPATRRRLKLDYYWPEIGVAVRFTGLAAKGQRRKSDWEILEEQQRDQTRAELCRLHGVQLAVIDPLEEPEKQLDHLLAALSRAGRIASQKGRGNRRAAMAALAKAQKEANALRQRLARKPEQTLATLAEAWRDREAGLAAALDASPPPTPKVSARHLARLQQLGPGDRVIHASFGPGVVTDVQGEGEERRIRVLFDGDRERSLLLRLAADKLQVGDSARA